MNHCQSVEDNWNRKFFARCLVSARWHWIERPKLFLCNFIRSGFICTQHTSDRALSPGLEMKFYNFTPTTRTGEVKTLVWDKLPIKSPPTSIHINLLMFLFTKAFEYYISHSKRLIKYCSVRVASIGFHRNMWTSECIQFHRWTILITNAHTLRPGN